MNSPTETTANSPMAPGTQLSVEPCTVVIFGASGDLSKRKLIPALYNLACEHCVSNDFQILGVGRTPVSDEDFRAQMHEAAKNAKDTRDYDEEKWVEFEKRLTYVIGDPNNDDMLDELSNHLETMHKNGASRNRIYYLSLPPSVTPSVIKGLGQAGLADETKGYARVVIEKPFGRDLESAKELNADVAESFKEEQVYRIDHYLGKETVQNILVFRFGNSLFEPIWNRNYIDYVEITAAEPLGIEGRSGYYEEAGALRDMVTNHLMQMLMLVAMEPPVAFSADDVREEKVQVLRSIRHLKQDQVAERTVRGQYSTGIENEEKIAGYRDEEGVKPGSKTETYAAVQFNIENWRWAGVPFYLRTGKRLPKQLTEIRVHFKTTPLALFARQGAGLQEPNIITIQIQPQEGINISFGAKVPGTEMRTGTVSMNFSYTDGFGVKSPAAYETLLLDVMQGDATLFTRRDEVESEWRLITPIENAWAAGIAPIQFYESGTNGPEKADELLRKNGHSWHDLSDNEQI
ncbi:MAG: glucose-6-phosphate dehydrogenase [Pyrinomonadaceae bacterium]